MRWRAICSNKKNNSTLGYCLTWSTLSNRSRLASWRGLGSVPRISFSPRSLYTRRRRTKQTSPGTSWTNNVKHYYQNWKETFSNYFVYSRDFYLKLSFFLKENIDSASSWPFSPRHVLVLDNLEERQFFGIPSGVSLNSCHFKIAVKTIAKLHAVGISHKLMLMQNFQQQEALALAKKTCQDVEVDGE